MRRLRTLLLRFVIVLGICGVVGFVLRFAIEAWQLRFGDGGSRLQIFFVSLYLKFWWLVFLLPAAVWVTIAWVAIANSSAKGSLTNRVAATLHWLLASSVATSLAFSWLFMVLAGKGSWTGGQRTLPLPMLPDGGAQLGLQGLVLLTVLALAVCAMAVWRMLQLSGRVPDRAGLRWANRIVLLSCVAFIPLIQQVRAYEAEEDGLAQAIANLDRVQAGIDDVGRKRPQFEAQLAELREQLRKMGNVMPTTTDPARAIEEIRQLASASGVSMTAGPVRRSWRMPDTQGDWVSRGEVHQGIAMYLVDELLPIQTKPREVRVWRTSFEIARIRLSFGGPREALERFRKEVIAKPEIHPSCWWHSLESTPDEESGVLMMETARTKAVIPVPRNTWLWPLTARLRPLREELVERSRKLESEPGAMDALSDVERFEERKTVLEQTIDMCNYHLRQRAQPPRTVAEIQTAMNEIRAGMPWEMREPLWLVAE